MSEEVNVAVPELPEVTTQEETTTTVATHEGDVYWKFLDELEGQFRAFMSEARAGDLNKQACLRARKQSVILRKSLKEYREVAVAHDKTHGRKNKQQTELNKEIAELNG